MDGYEWEKGRIEAQNEERHKEKMRTFRVGLFWAVIFFIIIMMVAKDLGFGG